LADDFVKYVITGLLRFLHPLRCLTGELSVRNIFELFDLLKFSSA
jgi:hypothetical protein